MQSLQIPKAVIERHEQLCRLCEKNKKGQLLVNDVAKYLGKSRQWLLRMLDEGRCPFGWGSSAGVGKGSYSIDMLQFYNYIVPTLPRMEQEHETGDVVKLPGKINREIVLLDEGGRRTAS